MTRDRILLPSRCPEGFGKSLLTLWNPGWWPGWDGGMKAFQTWSASTCGFTSDLAGVTVSPPGQREREGPVAVSEVADSGVSLCF